MKLLLIIIATMLFTALSVLHVYWAFGGTRFGNGAIPHADNGKPVFEPGKIATLIVAAGLLFFAATVAGNAGIFGQIVSQRAIRAGTGIIAGIFVLRAIGDFRYVGFFKRVKNTAFARKDTGIYTPLCVAIAAACFAIAIG